MPCALLGPLLRLLVTLCSAEASRGTFLKTLPSPEPQAEPDRPSSGSDFAWESHLPHVPFSDLKKSCHFSFHLVLFGIWFAVNQPQREVGGGQFLRVVTLYVGILAFHDWIPQAVTYTVGSGHTFLHNKDLLYRKTKEPMLHGAHVPPVH